MSLDDLSSPRRSFLKSFGLGAAAFAFAGPLCSRLAIAETTVTSKDLLSFRQNAAHLPLHFNENSLGMPARAVEAAYYAAKRYGHRYPDDAVAQLTAMLAKANSVADSQLILGNGSTEVLGAVVEYAQQLNATIIEPSPTFGDVRSRAQARGIEVIQVPTSDDFQTDIEALKKQSASIKGTVVINLCNPNNPTGAIVNSDELKEWVMSAADNHIFLIDEAYYEYAIESPDYHSVLPMIVEGKENLILTRTFSKIYGMAGMRIGYGIAAPKTAERLNKLATSYNLTITGVAAAIAVYEDTTFYQSSLQSNQAGKQILTTALDELGLAYIPSHANFVLHKIGSNLDDYRRRMQANKISVGRRMTEQDGWNRVSIGTPEQMKAFVQTLHAFREKNWV